VRDLSLPVEDVDGHEDDAEFHAGQEDIDHLDGVRQVDAQPVPGLQAPLAEQRGHVVATAVDLGEGVRAPAEFQGHGIAPPG